jgi:hypothetical protein
MKTDASWNNFTAGELSPRMLGRTDFSKYFNGAAVVRDFVVMPQGGACRRPGTAFAALASNQAAASRLVPFSFSVIQDYMLEFGNGQVRFYANGAIVVASGSPVTLAVPYQAADLPALAWTQSADTLFLTHPNYPPATLTRTGAATFSYQALSFRDGPYQSMNLTTTTISLSGTTGSVGFTFSSTTGINNGAGLSAADVGRSLRVQIVSCWAGLIITAVASTTTGTATIQAPVSNGAFGVDGAQWQPSTVYPLGAIVLNGTGYYLAQVAGYSATSGGPSGTTASIQDGTVVWAWTYAPPTATPNWMLGSWYGGNYPYVCMFWQNRLIFGGTNAAPNSVECSVLGDYNNMAPTQANGELTAENAMSWTITDDQVNAVCWLSPAGSAQSAQLGIGTAGGENILQPGNQASAMSATNIQGYRETYYASAPYLRPLRIGKSVLFVNRAGIKVHEWTFSWMVNGYLGPDLAELSEHLARPGIAEMVYQQNPYGVVWMRRTDGALVAMTYLRDEEVVAWHSHQLGGEYYGGPPFVEALGVIPASAGRADELWLQVLRTVDGSPVRTVEVMQQYWTGTDTDSAWFLDCAVSSDLTYPAATLTVSGATNTALPGEVPQWAGTVTLTASAAVFAGAAGSMIRIAGGRIRVQTVTDGQHASGTVLLPLANTAPAVAAAWSMDAPHTAYGGLDHLNGTQVAVLADGQVQPSATVAAGAITLNQAASRCLAGLPYTSKLVSMPAEPAKGGQPVATGKAKRADTVYIRLLESVGGAFGQRLQDPFSQLMIEVTDPIEARYLGDLMDEPPRVFTGVLRRKPRGGANPDLQIMVMQTDPMPMTVLSIGVRLDLEEVTPT